MNVGLFDVDNASRKKVTFPNLALMKLSAYHKSLGDSVQWIQPGGEYDVAYISKVFSDEYSMEQLPVFTAGKIIRGGSGYAISVVDGREVYNRELDAPLDPEVEHIYPDYDLYGIQESAYGFLTRGCPRGCEFCHVSGMQGSRTRTVARLSEFWRGQKFIHICDPNILASSDWKMHFQDLIDSKAYVDFNQGLDVRLLTDEKIAYLNQMRYKSIHFAWDDPNEDLRPHLERARRMLRRCCRQNTSVYILTNNGEEFRQDVDRVEFVKSLGMQPYVMIYRKPTAPKQIRRLARYANNPFICSTVPTFAAYQDGIRSERYQKTGIKYSKPNPRMR